MVEQGFGDLIVTDDLKESEKTDAGAIVFVKPFVYGCRDSTYRLPISPGKEVGNIGIAVVGVQMVEQTNETKEAAT